MLQPQWYSPPILNASLQDPPIIYMILRPGKCCVEGDQSRQVGRQKSPEHDVADGVMDFLYGEHPIESHQACGFLV